MTLATLTIGDSSVMLRRATVDDVPAIISLIAADQLATSRGDSARPDDLAAYDRAFHRIDGDDSQLLVVADAPGAPVIGTMQLTFIPGLSRAGSTRLQIEAVRVRRDHRDRRIGEAMMRWACDEGVRRGATLAQLTSDRSRTSAHRFYERLGFVPSHVGFKRRLDPQP
ncbi:GNAT family N-acetyltransferase [Cellulomonas sp. P24]|uniref:GNAT family N-acetyltransferase n=1 Tax=Cellulomonas sp. P24 TaxID=2885206 RepID=UPI00216B5507|nr:GNAT family N-acetyltransferase [Cellulomonas sp. P24]MCR6493813.1 GNAT family N-acetyltransferase [Cellulomonas sp. P24]